MARYGEPAYYEEKLAKEQIKVEAVYQLMSRSEQKLSQKDMYNLCKVYVDCYEECEEVRIMYENSKEAQ